MNYNYLLCLCLFLLLNKQVYGQDAVHSRKLTITQLALIDRISLHGAVRGQHGGWIALVSEQYSRFDSLKEISSSNDMLYLFNHRSPAVRVYAFQGLLDGGNWQQALSALMNNSRDTTAFYAKLGSFPGVYTVSYFLRLRLLSYLDNHKIPLDSMSQKALKQLSNQVVSHEEEAKIVAKQSAKILALYQHDDE